MPAAFLVAALSLSLAPPAPWVRVSDSEGILLESQAVAGSNYERLRATLVIEAPAERVAALHWGDGSLDDATGNVSTRELLVDEPDERVSYETAAAPLVSTRDYVVRFTRAHDAATGTRTMAFHTVTHPARPPRADRVRIARIEGGTVIEPVAGRPGACRVVHTVFSDPGGSIPAWIAKQGQRDATLKQMKALRARAARAAASR